MVYALFPGSTVRLLEAFTNLSRWIHKEPLNLQPFRMIPKILLLATPPILSLLLKRFQEKETSIEEAAELFPTHSNVLRAFAAFDHKKSKCGKQCFIAVICKRLTPDLKQRLRQQENGQFEEWMGYSVQYYCSSPSLEAQVVVDKLNIIKEKCLPADSCKNVEEALRQTIAGNSEELFKKYSNLTVIKPDVVRSVNYSTDNPTEVDLKNEPCIVFYVYKKHIVPVNEGFLPRYLGHFVTDVREGLFYPLADNPPAQDDGAGLRVPSRITLKPGCGISSQTDNRGTLGGFARCKSSGVTGFLTSYHLFFNFDNPDPRPSGDECVYYADDRRQFRRSGVSCGSISSKPNQRVFSNVEYGGSTYGADALFVQTEHVNRERSLAYGDDEEISYIKGHFPELPDDLKFAASPLALEELEHDSIVYKYGHETHLTEGQFVSCGTAVRSILQITRTLVPDGPADKRASHSFEGNNLISVTDIPGARGKSDRFAVRGDSGAFVFVVKEDKLRVIGMVEGRLSSGELMVIPIQPVLHHMNVELI